MFAVELRVRAASHFEEAGDARLRGDVGRIWMRPS